MFPPLAPLYEAQQHGEESEYSDEGKNDRYREQRCLLSLSRRSRDHRKVSAPKVTKPPVLLPNRNHQSHDATEDQRKAEVARRMGEIRGLDPWRLLDASEKLDDGEAEADQRCRRANPRHHRALDAEPRAQPGEMIRRR